MEKLGFIGMGNMAKALAEGFVQKEVIKKEQIFAYAPNQEKLKANAEIIGFTPVASLNDLCGQCDTLLVACKPYQIEDVLASLGKSLKGKTLVSVAAGWDYEKYMAVFKDLKISDVRVQFIMPNTPACVSEGVFLFEQTNSLEIMERGDLIQMFEELGVVIELPSNLMGIGGAISGCGPAFLDLMMEAYADAAVKYGIPRNTAYKMVSQTVLGSAKLQIETGKHPSILKEEVCSPGGTTIRGVAALEEKGFRDACISSIDAIMEFKKN